MPNDYPLSSHAQSWKSSMPFFIWNFRQDES